MAGTIRNIPLTLISTWPAPNYVDPVQRQGLVVYASVLQSVATVFVGVRIYLRVTRQAGPFGVDDGLLLFSFVLSTAFTGVGIYLSQHSGLGAHLWDLKIPQYEGLALLLWFSELLYIVCATCIKMSVLLLHKRITEGTVGKAWRYAILVALVFTGLCGIAFAVTVSMASCHPMEAYWKVYSLNYTANYTCIDLQTPELVKGVIIAVGDLYSVLLPICMLRQIQTSRKQKIALNVILCLGLSVCAAGVARTYYTWKLGSDYDSTWLGYDLYIWSDLEIQLGLICASAPAMRAFLRSHAGHVSKIMSSLFTTKDSESLDSREWPLKPSQTASTGTVVDEKKTISVHQVTEVRSDPRGSMA